MTILLYDIDHSSFICAWYTVRLLSKCFMCCFISGMNCEMDSKMGRTMKSMNPSYALAMLTVYLSHRTEMTSPCSLS